MYIYKSLCNKAALKHFKVYLQVAMRTTGYGPARAPSGWGEHQGCPAERWDEEEEGAHWGIRLLENASSLFLLNFEVQSQRLPAALHTPL